MNVSATAVGCLREGAWVDLMTHYDKKFDPRKQRPNFRTWRRGDFLTTAAASALFCYVLGEALDQQGATGGEISTLRGVVDAGAYRHLAGSPVEHLLDFDARFDFGLKLLMTGMRAALNRA